MLSLYCCFVFFNFSIVFYSLCLCHFYDFQIKQNSDIIMVIVIIYYLILSALRFDNKYRNLESSSNAGTMSSTKGDDVMYTHGKSSHHDVAKSSTSRDSWGSDGDKKKLHVNDAMEYWRWRFTLHECTLKVLILGCGKFVLARLRKAFPVCTVWLFFPSRHFLKTFKLSWSFSSSIFVRFTTRWQLLNRRDSEV